MADVYIPALVFVVLPITEAAPAERVPGAYRAMILLFLVKEKFFYNGILT
jgi:hypothetical protein